MIFFVRKEMNFRLLWFYQVENRRLSSSYGRRENDLISDVFYLSDHKYSY
jgi:hypothetical protein